MSSRRAGTWAGCSRSVPFHQTFITNFDADRHSGSSLTSTRFAYGPHVGSQAFATTCVGLVETMHRQRLATI